MRALGRAAAPARVAWQATRVSGAVAPPAGRRPVGAGARPAAPGRAGRGACAAGAGRASARARLVGRGAEPSWWPRAPAAARAPARAEGAPAPA
ncbi:hypothetical protein F6B41_33330 [Microbacterium lushaniae]|nr:hypothetical protein F6B41_33330 [Microbacterium lushaniae]